jgi:hypothetical protein
MDKEDKVLRGQKKEGEAFPDFEFDQLMDEDAEKESNAFASEGEVIELTDIIEKGDKERGVEDSGLDDFELLLDEDRPVEERKPIERRDKGMDFEDSGLDDLERLLEDKPVEERQVTQDSIGISQERIEAIITRVVEDVVERVARETMARVADKVIKEAIEELRESLELPQE